MRKILTICLSVFCVTLAYASPDTDSLREELRRQIIASDLYDQVKMQEIAKIKHQLDLTPGNDPDGQYGLSLRLYEEYKYYNYDSARSYADRLEKYAHSNPQLQTGVRLKLIFIMLSSGMFKETLDSLHLMQMDTEPDSLRSDYYSLLGRCYYDLADFNSDQEHTPYYYNKANLYFDSALSLLPRPSFEFSYYTALKFLKNGAPERALKILTSLIEDRELTYHQVALATSTIGGIYLSESFEQKAKPFLMQASIADIKSSTKETYALLSLASIVFKEGNLKDAVLYIEKANADANFYNTRFRKVQIGDILPLIEGEMINTIEDQKKKLIISVIALAVFAVLIAAFAIIIRKQVKKLKAVRQGLVEANGKLKHINQELVEANGLKEKYNLRLADTNKQLLEANEIKERYNDQLQTINRQLSEANKIKEEYIGYYLGLDTEFMSRFVRFVGSVDKKAAERKWEEIRFLIKSVDFQKEKEEMLGNFDKVFVRLFPNFVEQFNTLFGEEDRIILKKGQLLNAELRIFALIRLGITGNEKIAEILDYSINTIYAKKTKVRSRTIVNKDDFEKKLTEITTISV